jgi:hypothetical protein
MNPTLKEFLLSQQLRELLYVIGVCLVVLAGMLYMLVRKIKRDDAEDATEYPPKAPPAIAPGTWGAEQ